MKQYVILLILLCVEGIIIQNIAQIKNKKKVYLILVAIELVIFTGLRSTNVGSDTKTYINALKMFYGIPFNEIWNISNNPYGFEIGYLIFGKMCSFLYMNATVFLIVVAILIYIPFLKFVYENSKNPIISILVYFTFNHFYYSLGIFRQMIALSICLCSVTYLKQKKPIKYCIIIALATSFHVTSICWLPLYLLSSFEIEKYKRKIIPLCLICIPFGKVFSSLLLFFIPKYESYINTERAVGGGSYLMLLLLIILFIGSRFIYNKKYISRENEISIAGISLAIILQSVSYSFGLIGRAVCYYSIFATILIPEIAINAFTPKSRIMAKFLIGVSLIVLTIMTQFYQNKYICPFAFFWE